MFSWRRKTALSRAVLVALTLTLAQAALAGVCRSELVGALPDATLERNATGIDAALALKRAIDLVEPALPKLKLGPVPVGSDEPGYDAVRYLVERDLLPVSWRPELLDQETWTTMLNRFLGWYRLGPVDPGAPETAEELVEDLADVLALVAEAVRPAALLATDPNAGGRTVFWAIVWNWSVYPRLLVLRPSGDAMARPSDVLPALGNCAVRVSAYISAPQDTAKRLFLTHNSSRMYVVAATPSVDGSWPYEVPTGEELTAFTYGMQDLEGVDVFAAVFDGPSVGIGTLATLLPRMRTNISPLNLARYLQTP